MSIMESEDCCYHVDVDSDFEDCQHCAHWWNDEANCCICGDNGEDDE